MLSLLLILCSFLTYAQRQVAIIVDGNDSDTAIRDEFKKSADISEKYYLSQGFEVIRLNAAQGKGSQDLIKNISNQKNINKLHIAIFTHGQVATVESFKSLLGKDLSQFENSILRSDEIKTNYGLSTDLLAPLKFSFYLDVPSSSESGNLLGTKEIRDSLLDLKKNNPFLETTFISNACFGGNTVRALEGVPDTQVFASSSATQKATAIFMPTENLSYVQNFYDELKNGKSLIEASDQGQKVYLEKRLNLFHTSQVDPQSLLSRPQSSIEVLFGDACLGLKTEESCSEEEPVIDLSEKVGKVLTKQALSKKIEQDESYLNELQDLFLCSEDIFSKTEDVYRKALKDTYEFTEGAFAPLKDCFERPFGCSSVSRIDTNEWDKVGEILKSCKRGDLECLLNKTSQHPVLRVLVLYSRNLQGVGPKSDFCQQVSIARDVNGKLKSCLTDSKRIGPTLWQKLFSLYTQGFK